MLYNPICCVVVLVCLVFIQNMSFFKLSAIIYIVLIL